MIERMVGPEGISACALADDTGVSQTTLSRWLRLAREGVGMTDAANDGARLSKPSRRRWTATEKLRVINEASRLDGAEFGAYLRREGIHESTVEEWRELATKALSATSRRKKASPEAKELKEVKRELRRKEKALAEVAALLTLKKKAWAIWGDEDDDTNSRSGT